jgi:hypothetical protein
MPLSSNIQGRQIRGGELDPVVIVNAIDWTVQLQPNETLGSNDKTFTVPSGRLWQVLWIWVEYTSNATVGDRQLQVAFCDTEDDVIGQLRPNVVQAASLARRYMIGPSLANQAAFYDTDHIQTPMPPTIFLPAGYDVRIRDINEVSATDNMVIQMMIAWKVE